MSKAHHMTVLRNLRSKLEGDEKASLRYVLNRLETLETKLKTIHHMTFVKRDDDQD